MAARPHILAAVLRNPGLPTDVLNSLLLRRQHPHPLAPVAWFKPDYRDAAFELLQRLADAEGIRLSANAFSLRATITEIAVAERPAPEATELAAQIAALFGLTWGEP